MPIRKTEAVVLKTFDFRETSLIVRFFTKDFGKINGLIKGIRNEPQRYGGVPLSFSRNLIVFYEKAERDLNLVTQCDAQEQYLPIREDLQKIHYANYFIDLLDAVTQEYDQNEQLFRLILSTLETLCQKQEHWQVARIFEIKLLNISGFKPRLDACVHCQKKIAARGMFSSTLGGILCPQCLSYDKHSRVVLKGTLSTLEYIEEARWPKTLNLKISAQIAKELAVILTNFLDIHLEKNIPTRKFLI